MRAIIENKISPDYVLCCIPRVLEILGEKVENLEFTAAAPLIHAVAPLWVRKISGKFWICFGNFGNYGKNLGNLSHNFQNRS